MDIASGPVCQHKRAGEKVEGGEEGGDCLGKWMLNTCMRASRSHRCGEGRARSNGRGRARAASSPLVYIYVCIYIKLIARVVVEPRDACPPVFWRLHQTTTTMTTTTTTTLCGTRRARALPAMFYEVASRANCVSLY